MRKILPEPEISQTQRIGIVTRAEKAQIRKRIVKIVHIKRVEDRQSKTKRNIYSLLASR